MTQLHMTTAFAAGDAGQPAAHIWALQKLDVMCEPRSIEVGITCGMHDMCGESPCLCGAQDAWQDCACNGMETIAPDVTVKSDNPAAALPVSFGGAHYVVGLLPGDAELQVGASLKHYDDAQQTLQVHTDGIGLAGIAGVFVVCALVVALLAKLRKRMRREQPADERGSGR